MATPLVLVFLVRMLVTDLVGGAVPHLLQHARGVQVFELGDIRRLVEFLVIPWPLG